MRNTGSSNDRLWIDHGRPEGRLGKRPLRVVPLVTLLARLSQHSFTTLQLFPFGKELGLNNKIDKAGRLAAAITVDGVLFGCDVFLYKGVATASFPIRNGRLTTRAPFELNVIVGDSPTAIRINIDPELFLATLPCHGGDTQHQMMCIFTAAGFFFLC